MKISPTLADRFFKRVEKNGEGGCWIWIGAVQLNGYGVIPKGPHGTGNHLAHRASWFLHYGEIPDGLVIDHLCRNKKCVNPFHLRVCTQRENVLCGISLSAKNAIKVMCDNGHTLDDCYPIKSLNGNKSRKCRVCQRENVKRYYAAHRAKILDRKRAAYHVKVARE